MLIVSMSLLAVLISLYWLWPDYRKFFQEAWEVLTSGDESRIQDWVAGFGALGPAIIVFLMILQMFLLLVPSWLLMVIAVLAYGPVWGTLISIVAIAVASSFGYGAGSLIGKHTIVKLIGERNAEKVKEETDRYGLWAVVIARLNPLLSNDGISLLGGILRMGFLKFLGATLAGIAPLAVLIAIFGSEWETMKTGLIWISVVSLIGLAAKIWFDRTRQSPG